MADTRKAPQGKVLNRVKTDFEQSSTKTTPRKTSPDGDVKPAIKPEKKGK